MVFGDRRDINSKNHVTPAFFFQQHSTFGGYRRLKDKTDNPFETLTDICTAADVGRRLSCADILRRVRPVRTDKDRPGLFRSERLPCAGHDDRQDIF